MLHPDSRIALGEEHCSKHYGDAIANWCKTFWSEARGRMCLAHSRYAGCNNNMGIIVSWRDIKKLLPPNCSLDQFLGALWHYIKTALGEEHMQHLLDVFSANCDQGHVGWGSVCALQDAQLQLRARDRFQARKHGNRVAGHGGRNYGMRATDTASTSQDCSVARGRTAAGTVPAPGPWRTQDYSRATTGLTQATGSDGRALGTNASHAASQPLVRQYERLVIQDRVDADTDLREALKIYNNFHQLNHATEWGEIPLSCTGTCRICFGNCVCKHTLLFVLLFKPELRVPDSWIAATHLSVKSAGPSRELPGAGDFASLRSASATKRALPQRSRS